MDSVILQKEHAPTNSLTISTNPPFSWEIDWVWIFNSRADLKIITGPVSNPLPMLLWSETCLKATAKAYVIFQSWYCVIAMFPFGVRTRTLLAVYLHVFYFHVYLNVGIVGREAKEDLWPWKVPLGSCLCLRHESPGILSSVQCTREVVVGRISLAALVLSRDSADCWQVIKVGSAAEKWHLQTWVQVQREP